MGCADGDREVSLSISEQVQKLGSGPLSEEALREHIWPLFSRVRQREEIYLANHSLGRPLDQMVEDVNEAASLWYEHLDDAWGPWMDEIGRFRSQVARLLGHPDSSLIAPKTSAGQGLRAVLNTFEHRCRVISTRAEFDSLDFILKTYQVKKRAEITWIDAEEGGLFHADSILSALDAEADLLVVSQVVFGTGQIIPQLQTIIKKAHSNGMLVLVDAYHAAGVIPIQMVELDADFMIGGSYKYTRGGPGACWLAIHPRHAERRTLDTGWFAKKNPFGYDRSDTPEFGDAWLESTPPVLTMYQAKSGLELTLGIGVERQREYSLRQLEFLRASLRAHGVPVVVPDDPSQFGAFVLVESGDSAAYCGRLKQNGVNVDSRGRYARFGPDLLNSRDELEQAAEIAGKVLAQDRE